MGPKRYEYVIQKLTNALECLVTHPGDVRQRLISAYDHLRLLTEEDFLPEHKENWQWIINKLTKCEPSLDSNDQIWRTSVENTMKHIKNNTGCKIAKKIYELYWLVSDNQPYR